ncbi:hypothetical protein G5B39_11560 [Rhodobacteraceae bacterium SC52]|nr:hypothetical protein G5B39_11560 [Rhodobacteraceae bacterium SC52]
MQHSQFLGDLLSALFDRRNALGGENDTRTIIDLCRALLSPEGEVSGLSLASSVLARDRTLASDQKLGFFTFLNEELEFDAATVASLAAEYASAPSQWR